MADLSVVAAVDEILVQVGLESVSALRVQRPSTNFLWWWIEAVER